MYLINITNVTLAHDDEKHRVGKHYLHLTSVTLARDDDKRRGSQSLYKGGGIELVNIVQQQTEVTNVILASYDGKPPTLTDLV